MARLATSGHVLGAALLVSACTSVVPPTMPAFATKVETSGQGRNVAFTVTPWPLDASVAFLCVNKPGPEFTFETPVPAATARCVALDSATADDRLVVTFNSRNLSPDKAGQFRATAPAYLAVAGSRGPFSGATVLTVLLSPSPAAS